MPDVIIALTHYLQEITRYFRLGINVAYLIGEPDSKEVFHDESIVDSIHRLYVCSGGFR